MEFQLSETPILSSATKAFVNRDENLINLLGKKSPFLSVEEAIKGKQNFTAENRSILYQALTDQYKNIVSRAENFEAVNDNIELLKHPDTFTVTTGQQLHLFLGPAFVIYKILAVIKRAEELGKQFPDKKFVPVYWLASEDHDFEEIKETKIFNRSFTWQTDQKGACGQFGVEGVASLIEQIRSQIQLNESSLKMLNDFEVIYKTSATLSGATIRLVNSIFGSQGLVCLDADRSDLKRNFIPVIQKDILEQSNDQVFEEFSKQLLSLGLSNQLSGRNINFFYHSKNLRNRIVLENGLFKVQNTDIVFNHDQIKTDIENNPGSYSPNAMLRPLYQECILPNVSYIGGNAEVNYWLQIYNVFKINNINPPTLELRPSVWIIPAKTDQWLKKQNIIAAKLLISQDAKNLYHFLLPEVISLDGKIQEFNTLKKAIQDTAAQANIKELSVLVEAGKAFEKTLKNTEKTIQENLKKKHEEAFLKLEEIFNNYLNIKQIQERKTHSLELLIKHDNVVFTLFNTCSLSPGSAALISL